MGSLLQVCAPDTTQNCSTKDTAGQGQAMSAPASWAHLDGEMGQALGKGTSLLWSKVVGFPTVCPNK